MQEYYNYLLGFFNIFSILLQCLADLDRLTLSMLIDFRREVRPLVAATQADG